MNADKAIKESMSEQINSEVVVRTASESFRWAGSVQWPHPDEWDLEHWEFYRTAVFDEMKKRTGQPPYDSIKEDFLVGLRFTLEYGAADFKGVDIPAIVNGKAKIKPRFMTWFFNQWKPYVNEVLDPKG